mgnify:CR=1 FL=1
MKYLYLHGLGQKPDSWNRVIKETKVSKSSRSLSLSEMLEGKAATYKELYSAFSSECDKENEEIVLCGLSLGAVLTLNYAIDHPDKVKALVLIAAQYKMPKKLLKVQNMLFHLMPNSAFNKMGFKKADVINLCGTMAELDFSDSLHKVSCPVLIACGEKDNANKKTAKELCHYLNNSNFHELMKTGHEANIEDPEELAMRLNISYSWFRRVFKEYTGYAPAKYFQELKLRKAKQMLVGTSQSVKEISFFLGFQSTEYFFSFFKKRTGLTPLEYRSFGREE